MILIVGAFLGGLQFADLIVEDTGMLAGYGSMTELTVDFLTFLFFMAGSFSVYRKDKIVTQPVLRFGLAMIPVRIVHEIIWDSGVSTYCQESILTCTTYTSRAQCQPSSDS